MSYWMRSWSSSTKNPLGQLPKNNLLIQVSSKDCKQSTREEFQPTRWREFRSSLKIRRCKFRELIRSQKLPVVFGDGFWLLKGMQKHSKTSSQRRTKWTTWCRNWKDQKTNFKHWRTISPKSRKSSIIWLTNSRRPKAIWIPTKIKQTNFKSSWKELKNLSRDWLPQSRAGEKESKNLKKSTVTSSVTHSSQQPSNHIAVHSHLSSDKIWAVTCTIRSRVLKLLTQRITTSHNFWSSLLNSSNGILRGYQMISSQKRMVSWSEKAECSHFWLILNSKVTDGSEKWKRKTKISSLFWIQKLITTWKLSKWPSPTDILSYCKIFNNKLTLHWNLCWTKP